MVDLYFALLLLICVFMDYATPWIGNLAPMLNSALSIAIDHTTSSTRKMVTSGRLISPIPSFQPLSFPTSATHTLTKKPLTRIFSEFFPHAFYSDPHCGRQTRSPKSH